MPLFDSMAMSFGTAGTGGFGIVNSSCGDYTSLQQWIFTIFMILFGVNFNVYYLFLIRKPKDALHCEEMRGYLGIILVSTLLITWNIRGMFPDILTALKHAAFQVGSIITTTGYSTTDFDLWPGFSKTILVCLMFVGACAGSTGGGIKVTTFVVLVATVVSVMFGKEDTTLNHRRIEKGTVYRALSIINRLDVGRLFATGLSLPQTTIQSARLTPFLKQPPHLAPSA